MMMMMMMMMLVLLDDIRYATDSEQRPPLMILPEEMCSIIQFY